MNWLPRSLLWRTFLLLAALVLLTTAAWFLIFRAYEIEPRARALAQNLVSVVNLTRVALITAQPERRRDLLTVLAEREGIQVYSGEASERLVRMPDTPLLQLTMSLVRQQLGEDTRFAARRDDLHGLWVSFHIGGDEYWVRIPRERLEQRIALRWIAWCLLALVLALLAAYFIVNRVSRPLKALASAAMEIGKGRLPPPVEEAGADEIRTLSRAFNQMTRDLSRLDQDRTLILAGVSHDLRTPLARLRLGIEMSGADASLQSGMHADIEDMDRIIGQFMDFARMDAGSADGNQTAVLTDLKMLMSEVIERYRALGHTIAARLDTLPEFRVQAAVLRRALANLIDNALKYAGGDMEVCLRREGTDAIIEVLDRGPGIPDGEMERLKRPFTRLEQARSNASGSGLGLAIVERITQAHHGRFELAARAGGGLIARIRLPLP